MIFGYPLRKPDAGGLLWTKKVADYLAEQKGVLHVVKVSSESSIKNKLQGTAIVRNIHTCLAKDARDAFEGRKVEVNVAMIDSWGEANIILWRSSCEHSGPAHRYFLSSTAMSLRSAGASESLHES